MKTADRIAVMVDHYRMSLSDFASKTGIGKTTLHSYIKPDEKGRAKIPLDTVLNIVQTFPEVNRDWLVFGEGEMLEKKAPKIGKGQEENFLDKYIKAMEDSVSAIKELSQTRKELAESRFEIIDCLKGHLANPSGITTEKAKR